MMIIKVIEHFLRSHAFGSLLPSEVTLPQKPSAIFLEVRVIIWDSRLRLLISLITSKSSLCTTSVRLRTRSHHVYGSLTDEILFGPIEPFPFLPALLFFDKWIHIDVNLIRFERYKLFTNTIYEKVS